MASTAGENQRTTRVFISYSHDSAEHCDRVLELAQQLRRDGIDAIIDQFHQDKLIQWPRWCEEQLRTENSDFVLCVCTPEYKRRVEGKVPADVGKGVFWEGTLIYNYVYEEKDNRRCVPVLMGAGDESSIPSILGGYTRFRLDKFDLSDVRSAYAKLYRLLLKQPGVQAAVLGQIQKLPPLSEQQRKTDFIYLIEEFRAKVDHIEQVSAETKADTSEILAILRKSAPPQSTVARPHNLPPWMPPEIFTGRETELRELCDRLSGGDDQAPAVVQPQVIIGGGGFGKTRLAIQVAWVLYLEKKCDMAFVISASSPAELDTQLAALDAPSLVDLYHGEQPPRELDIRKQNVIHALREKAGRWILVLDAADSDKARDAVNELLSQLAGGRFLVTSRRDDWPRSTVRKLPLDLFTIEEARACLLSRYWKSEPPVEEIADFGRVATELGFLPLALVLAASYMDSRRIIPARYMSEWRQKHDTLLGFKDVEHGRSLLAAFKLSHDLLSSQAAHLLHMLAWLAPEPLPRRLVEDSEKMREILSAGIEGSAGGDPTEALAELRTLSLLQLDDESVRLHRLVLRCARATLPEGAQADACAIALEWVRSVLPDTEYDETDWKLWNRLSPHLDEVIAAGNALKIESEALGTICGKLGLWLFCQARHNEAEPLMRRALAIDEKSYGKEHVNVTTALSNLAQLLKATNRLAEAEPLMRRVVEILEKSPSNEYPNVASALNNLAQLLKDTNRLEEAEPMMRRALAIDEKNYGPEHPNVATDTNNLADLLTQTNRLEEAEPLMRRALAIDEKNYGPEHPNVAIRLNNLALLLQDTNRLEEAEPLMRRALAIAEKSYGPEHPSVATTLNNLALSLQDTNRLGEAEPLMRRALAIDEKSYGPEHPSVAIPLNNLAQLLKDTNRLEEAEPLTRRVIDIFEKAFGRNHPNVATALNNLALLLKDTNRLEEAEPLMRRALTIDETSYGPEHPDVAIRLNNLADLLKVTNRVEEAEPLMCRALTIDEKSYGPEHPKVAIDLNNLAGLLQATNRLEEAEPLMRRALAIAETSYGPEHPGVAIPLNNLATLLLATNRLEEAEPMMRQVVAIFLKFTRSTGHLHPHLKGAFGNYRSVLEALSLSEEEIDRRIAEVGKEAGLDEQSYHALLAELSK